MDGLTTEGTEEPAYNVVLEEFESDLDDDNFEPTANESVEEESLVSDVTDDGSESPKIKGKTVKKVSKIEWYQRGSD